MKNTIRKMLALGAASVISATAICGCAKTENETVQNDAEAEVMISEEQTEESDTSDNTEEMENTEAAEISAQDEAKLKAAKIRHYYGGILSQLTCALQLPGIEIEDDGEMSQNKYAITDIDKDGREELLISYSTASMTGMFVVMYDYNPDTNTLQQEWINDADEIQIDYKAVSYDNFGIYTEEYLTMLRELNGKDIFGEETDIGLYYLEGKHSLDEVAQFLVENYGIALETNEELEEEEFGLYEGKEIFRFMKMDSGLLTYSEKRVGDITMFGLYPGMDESMAYEQLKLYGFYPYGEAEAGNCFITGEGIGNRSLWYESEDGKITAICTHHFCAFAG